MLLLTLSVFSFIGDDNKQQSMAILSCLITGSLNQAEMKTMCIFYLMKTIVCQIQLQYCFSILLVKLTNYV